jgi:hypothetical protein
VGVGDRTIPGGKDVLAVGDALGLAEGDAVALVPVGPLATPCETSAWSATSTHDDVVVVVVETVADGVTAVAVAVGDGTAGDDGTLVDEEVVDANMRPCALTWEPVRLDSRFASTLPGSKRVLVNQKTLTESPRLTPHVVRSSSDDDWTVSFMTPACDGTSLAVGVD